MNHFFLSPTMVEKAATKKRVQSYYKSPWTEAERAILDPHVATFHAADKDGRKQLLGGTVIPAIYILHPTWMKEIKLNLSELVCMWCPDAILSESMQKVKAWFSNNGRRKDVEQSVKLLPTRISLGTIIANEEKVAIEREVQWLSGTDPGSKEYLHYYRQGLKNVKEGLPPEKLEQYQNTTSEWEEYGYPQDLQRWWVTIRHAITSLQLIHRMQVMLKGRALHLPSRWPRPSLSTLVSRPSLLPWMLA